jgi:hypothetical protein
MADLVSWDDINELEQLEVQAKVAGSMPMDKLLGIQAEQPDNAAYVVELFVKPRNPRTTLYFGHIMLGVGGIHGNGSDIGAGDGLQSLHLCGKCGGPVPSIFITADHYVCPRCQHSDRAENISEGAFFRLGIDRLAKLATEYWRKVDGDADVVVRRLTNNAHRVAEAVKNREFRIVDRGRRESRENMVRAVYSRNRLMRDNFVADDVVKTIKNFLLQVI